MYWGGILLMFHILSEIVFPGIFEDYNNLDISNDFDFGEIITDNDEYD